MRILESGHYYLVKGPTLWARRGWEILEKIKRPEDKTMLMVDDLHHNLEDVAKKERDLPIEDFFPEPDFTVMESSLRPEAERILSWLMLLPRGQRVNQDKQEKFFLSGIPLTNGAGQPLCILLDAGLTLKKHTLGFKECVNILPFFYQEEQSNLLRIVKKTIPGLSLEVILYDLDGKYWYLTGG